MPIEKGKVLLKKYKILELLGSGAWGEVYLAEDMELNRQVAIKHLKGELARDQVALGRFLREARTVAALRHVNVVTIYALERENDNHYIVMEYAERGTLRRLLAEVPDGLPIAQAIDIASDVCQALDVVHRKKIIHGDIKPSNVLLFFDGEKLCPKLSDFGLSRASKATPDVFSGTLEYASPEQLLGEPIDLRSDLYSVGIVLYETLVGELPFLDIGKVEDIIRGRMEHQPVPPSQKRPGLSPALDRLLLTALSKDPERRYQSAGEMADALKSARAAQIKWEREVEMLYNQGVGYFQEEEWEEAAEALRGVLERNSAYEDAASKFEFAQQQLQLTELYERAQNEIQKEDWEKATETLEKITQLDPEYRDAVSLLRKVENQLEMADLYVRVTELEKGKEWHQVIDLFVKILSIDPSYQDVPTRLAKAHRWRRLQLLYEEAEAYLVDGRWHEAAEKYKAIVADAGTAYEDAAVKLEKAKRLERLEILYGQGIACFDRREWEEAITHFEEVVQLDPAYEDAAVKLAEANREKRLETSYSQGMSYFNSRQWLQAIECLEDVVRLAPGYKDATVKLAEARKKVLYNEGLEHFDKEEWPEAIEKLEEVLLLDSAYGDTTVKLEEARRQQELESLYAEALKHEDEEEWPEAIAIFVRILSIDNAYKDVPQRLALAHERRASAIGVTPSVPEPPPPQQPSQGGLRAWWDSLSDGVKSTIVGGVFLVIAALCGIFAGLPAEIAKLAWPSTSTPTATSSPTHTVTPLPGFTLTLTPFSTLTSTPYPASASVSPDEGTSFAKGKDVKLVWEWERDLAENEFFEVRIRLKGEQEFDQMGLIKMPYQLVRASKLTQAGTYEWQVAIVSLSGEEKGVSQIWSFEVQ